MLGHITVTSEPTEVDLVFPTTKELTGQNRIYGDITAEIFSGAHRLGYKDCPAEVGPQLCLQYRNSAYRVLQLGIVIGMDPIIDSVGAWDLFRVIIGHRSSKSYLDSDKRDPKRFRDNDERWAFIKPRGER